MKTYKGKIRIGRPMNDTRKPRMVDVEVTHASDGRYVVEVSIDEAEVPRMLMGGSTVTCEVRDFRDQSPQEIVDAFKAGAMWAHEEHAKENP